jgi:hypothetical protein
MWGCKGEDYTINTRKAFNGCGKWGEKGANGPKKHERTSQIN